MVTIWTPAGKTCCLKPNFTGVKVFNFYFLRQNPQITNEILQKIYFARIKKIMLKEKTIALTNKKYDEFDDKWKVFTPIYDYRGPDIDHISWNLTGNLLSMPFWYCPTRIGPQKMFL